MNLPLRGTGWRVFGRFGVNDRKGIARFFIELFLNHHTKCEYWECNYGTQGLVVVDRTANAMLYQAHPIERGRSQERVEGFFLA